MGKFRFKTTFKDGTHRFRECEVDFIANAMRLAYLAAQSESVDYIDVYYEKTEKKLATFYH